MRVMMVTRSLRFLRPSLVAIIFTVASLLQLFPAHAIAQSVALVIDVSGRVTGNAPVTILSEIAADSRLHVARGGRLVVIYLRSGDEYTFNGPSELRFRATAPEAISGAKPQVRVSPFGRGGNVRIRPLDVSQGAFVMRSARPTAQIKLLALSGTKTLDTSPEFRWHEIEPSVKYRFELTDETGRSLHEAEVQLSSFKLPDSVRLREGVGYTWEVSARTPDGRRYVSAGDFSIAASDLRNQAHTLRPPSSAPVSERVAYAAWLEQMELRDEARKYWKVLNAERPEDAKLKSLAAD